MDFFRFSASSLIHNGNKCCHPKSENKDSFYILKVEICDLVALVSVYLAGCSPCKGPRRLSQSLISYLYSLSAVPSQLVPLESVISSFGFNCLGSKLVGMFFGIVPMFVIVPNDFVRHRFIAQIRVKMCVRVGIRAYLRKEATPVKSPRGRVVEKPENRVHI